MKPEQLTEILEVAAGKVGVNVRYEPLPPGGVMGSGGLCRIHEEWHLIIDKKATPAERIAAISEVLDGFDLSGVELPPKIRKQFEDRKSLKAETLGAQLP